MTSMSGPLARMVIHPQGWFAGARAALAVGMIWVLGLAAVGTGIQLVDFGLVAIGVALMAGALGTAVSLTYAAASNERRRNPRTPSQPGLDDLPPQDVNDLMTLMFKRIDRMEDRLMAVIREGREAHSREHAEQANACLVAMGPLNDDFKRRMQAKEDSEARIGPIKAVFVWATNHWQITCTILGLLGAVIFALGYSRP